MPLICYVNGEFIEAKEAKVSAFDHGFLYGDGIFESLTASGGRIFRLREHLDRLERSARALRLALPETKERIAQIVKEAIRRSEAADVYIRVIVSRGEGYPLLDPRTAPVPTLAVLLHEPSPPAATASTYKAKGGGLRLKTAGVRKTPPECLEPRVKSLNYLNHVLARIEAIEAGCDEAVLLDLRGFVAEAAGENIFIVKEGVLKTPRAHQALDGITRRTVLGIASRAGIPAQETDLTLYDLYTADEAFLTSSFSRVHAVAEVDGRPIPAPGPVTAQLRREILELERTEGEPIA
ncbi:MAG: aminotransferase class IV [Candidatus Tectomicrobia bacterium]|uniref:branched-chain-amino-acid transaminase n=1 Tax=Tectimicrobiota bacterium TaxID=2528274 RepID=A0A932HWH1_UNCTE|nr:aminotransferase class IV [Candidatus Tectomicrobia bacterium]